MEPDKVGFRMSRVTLPYTISRNVGYLLPGARQSRPHAATELFVLSRIHVSLRSQSTRRILLVEMVSIQLAASKGSALTRNLPTSVTFDKPLDQVTVLDVKKAIAAKNAKVWHLRNSVCACSSLPRCSSTPLAKNCRPRAIRKLFPTRRR